MTVTHEQPFRARRVGTRNLSALAPGGLAAVQVWLTEISAWWPLASHSVVEHDTSVAFVGDEILETSSTGETALWGTVLAASPPSSLTFTWHPGRGPEGASTVTVDFVAQAGGITLVRLTHSGWEVFADPAAARDQYGQGWPVVLARLVDHVAPGPVY